MVNHRHSLCNRDAKLLEGNSITDVFSGNVPVRRKYERKGKNPDTCVLERWIRQEETVDWAPPTDDDDMGYEEVMEAARRVPRHLVVIGSDTDSDTDVVDPFDDFAYDFAQDA
ncbi:hypothetical protein AgCh_033715 [Apium graveolens]